MKSFYNRMAALLHVFFLGIVALQAQSPQTFNHTGAEQIFTVPAGVTMVHVITFAATGGAGNSGSSVGAGGKGGKVEADLAVTPGQILYIYVGGKGIQGGAGGFNGGGGTGLFFGNGISTSGGGGGATDIRIGGNALSNRVLVAGGGGGCGAFGSFTGGAGGGLTGGTGGGNSGGTGGTASAGGNTGGALGLGGSGTNISGGGGGYYGGGYVSPYSGGGGGGSSYTDPTLCSNVIHTQGASDPDSHGSLVLSWTAPTYQPVVTEGGSSCSVAATYNYDGDYNGKPSFSVDGGDLVIRWEADNQWHIRAYSSDAYQNAQNTTLPPCDGWTGCGGEPLSVTSGCECAPPTAYALTGGGRSCDNGVSIVLEDSELGVTYQLKKDGNNVGDPVEGTDESFNFGDNFTESGIYTVVATRTVGSCTAEMTGSATITPCFFGLGALYCSDDNTVYTLTGSDAPSGTFSGPGVTDNGDGTATFNPSLAGSGGTVTYTVGSAIRPAQLTSTTGNKSADPGGSTSTSQNVAVYLCTAPPTFTGLNATYCDLDESVTLTGSFAPLGFFDGPGITDNGDGTATFDPGAANLGENTVRYLYSSTNFNGAWVSMSAGFYHSMAIKTDGSLWAWGNNEDGELGDGTNIDSDIPVQIDAATDWASVSTGGYHTLATKTDGTLWAWGYNSSGALGNGTNTDSNVPVQIGTDADWVFISAGFSHNMAMKTDGTIWTWGNNIAGQLGNGTNGINTNTNEPIQVGSDADWASISAGDRHSLATKTDGTLWAWGQNTTGQLGNGTNTLSNVPVQVGIDTDWNKAAGGSNHTLATKTNGTLWAWGNNYYGQLGNGNNTDSNTPIQVGTDADWAGITACSTSVAIKTNGSLWAWGANLYGQIGNGSLTDSNTPLQVGTDNNWVSADAGSSHTLGLKTDGSLQAWGSNEDWQLGNGGSGDANVPTNVVTTNSDAFTVTITQCPDFTGLDAEYCGGDETVLLTGNYAPEGTFSGPGVTDNGDGTASFDPAAAGTGGTITYTYGDTWTNASAGAFHSMAVQANGSLWGWGYNADGELGDGSTNDQFLPVASGNGTNDWAKVSGGYLHSLGLKTDGTLWAWGFGENGELGNGANDDSNVPVQVGSDSDWAFIKAGYYVSYGIKTNGTLWAWGYGENDLLGDGSEEDSNTPIQIGTDTDWASVSNHSDKGRYAIAVKTDGSLWAWGDENDYGQFGNGTTDASATPIQIGTATDWVNVDAGLRHAIGLKTDGTLWVWGNNEEGQLGNGTTDNSLVPIQVGTETNWASASANYYSSLATKTDGTLWGWGYNEDGELGNGTNDDSLEPLQSGTATNWASVSSSDQGFTLGLQTDGSLWAWGFQEYGQLGDGLGDVSSNVPLRVGAPPVTFSKNVTINPSVLNIDAVNISAADCNNTTCTEDDTYTADITVTYSSLPASGTLDLSGSDIAGAAPSVNVEDLGATSYTFTGVTLRADGDDIELTAAFSGGCDYTDDEVDTAPTCSGGSVYTLSVVDVSGNSEVASVFTPETDLYNNAPQWSGSLFGNTQRIRWDASNSRWEIVILPGTLLMSNTNGDTENLPCTSWQPSGNLYPSPITLSGGCGPLTGGNTSTRSSTPSCDITNISIANATACNDNGSTDANDDYFTADVTVTFQYAPEFKTLVLTDAEGVVLATKEASDDLLCTTTWTFEGVQLPANGQDVVLTAEFRETNRPADQVAARTGDDCIFTSDVLMTAPASCSCPLTGITASNISAADCKNTTCTTDDTFTADVTVLFTAKPATGTLSLSGPTIVGTVPSVNVADIGTSSYTFIGVTLKADGEEFELTATFSEGCTYTDDEVDYAPSCGAAAFTPTNITVAGFGLIGANGTYTPNGTLNGAPKWESVYGPGNFRIVWTGSRWEIQDAQGPIPPYAWAANTGGSGTITNLPCSGGWIDPLDVESIGTEVVLSGGCGDLSAPAGPTCSITGMSIGNMGACNDNGTTTATDDYFVSGDVAVAFAYAPSSGNLVIKRGNTVLGTKSAAELSCVTEWFFLNVQMSADGQPLDIIAEFTGTSCTLTQNFGNAPASCSCVPPTFTACPTNKTAFTASNACTAVVDYTATADGSPASVITYALTGVTPGSGNGIGIGTAFNKGVTTVTLTATNDCGAPTCQFTVTVTDNVKPIISCPANRTVNVDQDLCSSVQTYDVTATDNCSASTTQTAGLSSGTAFPVGTTTNGFTATDAAGNTSACAFTVTVVDNQKPVIACPANRTVNADQGQCSSVQSYTVTTTDNCAASTQPTAGLSTGAAFPVGITINAFLATDAAGNTATCSFSIRVLDTQLPVVSCPANTTLGIGDNCSTPLASYGLANKSDNCSTAIFETQSPVAGTIVTGHNTAQTVTLTATDAGGNTASCSFVVTLKDVMAPSITCPANIIRPTDPNLCSAAVTYATPIYSDNCSGGGAVHINGGTSGSAFAKGTTTVNWQATDGVGLTKTCSFTITVNDAQAPTITCPANMVRSNDAGQCSASVTYPTPKAADNCSLPAGQPQWVSGGTSPTASGANSIATFQKGATIVTWRATDGAGLTKTCTFRVTVNDTEAPTLTCPAAMSLTTAPNTCSSVATTYTNPTFTDNCALTNSTATRINGLASGSSFPLGNSNVVFQATDAAGNTRRCTMVVTVTDNQPPVVNCPASVVATGTGTPCRATVFYGSTTASDNCAGTLTPFLVTGLASGSQYPAGVTTNTFRAVAPNGQSSECSFSVTVDCGSGMGNNGVEVRNTNLSIQHGDKLELKLAPNPALSTVTVSIEGVGASGGTLLVYDAVGRLVLRQVIAENQQTAVFQVDGSEFAPGMYRVNLRTETGMVTKTLVVVK